MAITTAARNGVTSALTYAITHRITAATPTRPSNNHPVSPDVTIHRGTRAYIGTSADNRAGDRSTGSPESPAGFSDAAGSAVVTASPVSRKGGRRSPGSPAATWSARTVGI